MAKKKPADGVKKKPNIILDRGARIGHAEAVSKQVQAKVDEWEGKHGGVWSLMVGGGRQLGKATVKKYEATVIAEYAWVNGLEPDVVRVCVALTRIIDKISLDAADLEDAVCSGRLMLLQSELSKVASLDSDKLEEWLRGRLADQV